jgi:hypothetical protein
MPVLRLVWKLLLLENDSLTPHKKKSAILEQFPFSLMTGQEKVPPALTQVMLYETSRTITQVQYDEQALFFNLPAKSENVSWHFSQECQVPTTQRCMFLA